MAAKRGAALERAALEAATKKIRTLKRQAEKAYYYIGKELLRVAELELYRAKKHETLVDYIREETGLSQTTAFQYMRVAEAYGEEICTSVGADKLDAALLYIARTPEEETPKDVPRMTIEVPRGRKKERVRFADATVREVKAAAAGKAERRGATFLPDALKKKLAKANVDLDRVVGKNAAAGANVRVRERGKSTVLEITGVPLQHAAKALRIIAAALS
jgi:hypothetical protein